MLLDHLLRPFPVGTSSHFALGCSPSSGSCLIHSKYEGNATTIQNGLASLSAAKNYPLQKNESNKIKNLTILLKFYANLKRPPEESAWSIRDRFFSTRLSTNSVDTLDRACMISYLTIG